MFGEGYGKRVEPIISKLKTGTAPHGQNVELSTGMQSHYQRYAELDVQERERSELNGFGSYTPFELGNDGKGVRSELSGESGGQ